MLISTTHTTKAVTIKGMLNSPAKSVFTIDYYATDAALADASGFGEGQMWIGSQAVTTGITGDIAFTGVFAGSQVGKVITATATATSMTGTKLRNTSEFSNTVVVAP